MRSFLFSVTASFLSAGGMGGDGKVDARFRLWFEDNGEPSSRWRWSNEQEAALLSFTNNVVAHTYRFNFAKNDDHMQLRVSYCDTIVNACARL